MLVGAKCDTIFEDFAARVWRRILCPNREILGARNRTLPHEPDRPDLDLECIRLGCLHHGHRLGHDLAGELGEHRPEIMLDLTLYGVLCVQDCPDRLVLRRPDGANRRMLGAGDLVQRVAQCIGDPVQRIIQGSGDLVENVGNRSGRLVHDVIHRMFRIVHDLRWTRDVKLEHGYSSCKMPLAAAAWVISIPPATRD